MIFNEWENSNCFIDSTSAKICSFSLYPKGWAYGEGEGMSQDVIQAADKVLQLGKNLGFTTTDAFPGLHGEIRVTFYQDDHYIQVTTENDLTSELVYERANIEQLSIDRLLFDDLVVEMSTLGKSIWTSFALSTQNTTMQGLDVFRTYVSSNLLRTKEYPLYPLNVSRHRAPLYVNTSGVSMGILSQSHLYIGESRQVNYHQNAA